MSIKVHPPQHIPVLLEATLATLSPKPGESYLDLTAGYGGHASKVLEITGEYKASVLVDRDDYAIEHLSPLGDKGAQIRHSDFLSAAQQLVSEHHVFDMILVDLGVSSPQLDQGERGFSFMHDGPLDMRMDRRQETTAASLIDTTSKYDLAQLIHLYGEEPYTQAMRIAELIVANRPFRTTHQLAQLIEQHVRRGKKHIHPATRTFQALRIAVNDELRQIETLLTLIPRLLARGGRVAIISFHSLEDRFVKRFFKEQAASGYEAELIEITKKPISGATEDVHNPRARSAKLRAAVKK